jgi:hypothetical protein
MNLKKYNLAEVKQLSDIRDRLKWLLGEEIGFDPRTDPKALAEVENRLAHWLLEENGGQKLAKETLTGQHQ